MLDADKGLVFQIQKMSTEDGPGIRTTVFMKQCPLKCVWCHNPESILKTPQLEWLKHKCIGCKTCIETCQLKALSLDKDGIHIDREKCTSCGECAESEICSNYVCLEGESPKTIPENLPTISFTTDCESDFSCGKWSECHGEADINDIVMGKDLTGARDRLCEDLNKCSSNFIETEECDFRVPVSVKIEEWCGENYLEVRNSSGEILIIPTSWRRKA